MGNKDFTVEDLVMDESFQQYCMGTDQKAVNFWTSWILTHPQKNTEFTRAKSICYILGGNNNAINFTKDENSYHQLLLSKGIDTMLSNSESFSDTTIKKNVPQKYYISNPAIKSISTFRRIAIAASLLFILGTGTYFILNSRNNREVARKDVALQILKNDIKPGGNKAILTLANGKSINLSDSGSGELAKQTGIIITKTSNGQVLYSVNKEVPGKRPGAVQLNLITTPRGGQYQIVLVDGTRVWLNAASSLKFPTTFANLKERKVELSGEAYFEVTHNSLMPFRVTVNGQTIEDLGTQFNINAYNDEPALKTTLLEGSIKIYNSGHSRILKPGQQAQLKVSKPDEDYDIISGANTEEAIAWHLGLFKFDNSDIKTVMRQIARWYNVDVEYEGNIPADKLSGEMYRSVNASDALQILKYAQVNFRIENKKIILTP